MNREPIYTALFALVSAATGLKTVGRRLKHFEEIGFADQPALFMVQKSETSKVTTKMPTVWTLHVDVVLYGTNSGQQSVAPMSSLNPIVDAISASLLPSAPTMEEQTLGGLVERCRIEGEIVTDEGSLGDQAVVVIPVTILVTE